jgi:hypothetical protein
MYFVGWSIRNPAGASDNKMSRILEVLKNAQRVWEGKPQVNAPIEDNLEIEDRRRSRRWPLDISVFVYGHEPGNEPFHEEAHTLKVNANGALLLLSIPVKKGQSLLLTNESTQKEQDCRVVFLGTRRSRTIEAGVAFPLTNPGFWNLPPEPEHEPAA